MVSLLRMVSFLAVVLSMANVFRSEDLVEQVTPKHLESPRNLVSKDITVLPRLPTNGVLSPGQENAVTPGGSVYNLATWITRSGASRLFVNQGSTTSEIEEKFRKSTASDKMRNKRKR